MHAAIEDLRWIGLDWEGGPVFQSERREDYLRAWRKLRDGGFIYPCTRSRREISSLAPHAEEPVFPKEWRPAIDAASGLESQGGMTWRFRVPDEARIFFTDKNLGGIERVAFRDFGDFVVWSRDDIPSYELAVVVDDLAMGVTEVVRGADLLTSTARQILLYRALGGESPDWFHCLLVGDSAGRRLAKRSGGLALRELRDAGMTPSEVMQRAVAAIIVPC